jgi:intraflagellar transport protein 122
VNLVHEVDISHDSLLLTCAHHLKTSGHYAQAAEVYDKLGDYKSLVTLYVDSFQWDNTFDLVRTHSEYRSDVYFPYATWLIENDRFDEAQEALDKAGRQTEALHLLEQLAENAITETRFEDAGYYYWLLAKSCLRHANRESLDPNSSPLTVEEQSSKFRYYLDLSENYHVYSTVHQFIDQPFTNTLPDVFLNSANYLLHKLADPYPKGISKFAVLFTVAKHAKQTGAYKLARHALKKIQSLRVPASFQENVDKMSLTIRAKPFHDKEDLLPMCYRCSTTNTLLRPTGNACISCRQPLEFSFVSFEPLPVVEFALEEGISDEEALRLIRMEAPQKKSSAPVIKEEGTTQTLVLTGQTEEQETEDDPFTTCNIEESGEFHPVVVGRAVLTRLHRSEVVVKRWGAPIGNQYYRSVMPDFPISLCGTCNKMFLADDYELQGLCKGHCPFCRKTIDSM